MTHKPPKFVHVRLRDGSEIVIHTAPPAFVAKVTHNTHNTDDTIDIKPCHFLGTKNDTDNDPQKMAGLMRRMGDWYFHTVVKNKPENDDEA